MGWVGVEPVTDELRGPARSSRVMPDRATESCSPSQQVWPQPDTGRANDRVLKPGTRTLGARRMNMRQADTIQLSTNCSHAAIRGRGP